MAKGEDKKTKGKSGYYEVVSDPRFAKVYSDPRFKAPKRKDLKVKIDDRFSKEELSIKKSTAKVDRFGRKIKNLESDKSDFDKYYEKEDEEVEDKKDDDDDDEDSKEEEEEEEEAEDVDEKKEDGADEDEEDDDEDDEEEEELTGDALKMYNKARGITDENEDSDSDDSSDDDSEEEIQSEEEDDFEIEEAQAPEGEPTSIFAVVNMDWDHIKAVDLMATFQSFVPTDGKIINISIYPSEYGKERMQREEIEGPLREFFQDKDGSKDQDEEEDDEEEEDGEEEEITNIAEAAKELYEEGEGIDYSSKSLRKYQLQRLRYFYAVVRCDSMETAKNIYDSCDGTEYESTSNIFDLRYVPEDMEFEDSPRDFCNKIPVNYKPNDFTTDALQHSKVKFTWDETPADRVHLTNKSFSQKEIEDMDFKAYLASDSEGSDDEEEMKNKYKALSSGLSFGKDSGNGAPKEEESEGEIDMEITFTPGLAEKVKKQDNEEDDEDESTLSKYQRREKDRRKKRKEKLKQMRKDQEDTKKQEKVENKKKNQNNKNKSKKETEQELKERANLELLMADENDKEDAHYNLKDIMKAEKQLQKQKKNKNKKSGKDQEIKIDTDIKIDEGDDRFNEIFEDHRFTIDPTNTEFKKTTVMDNLLKSKDKKKNGKKDKNNNKKRSSSDVESSEKNSGIKNLADKIKNKQKKRRN